MLFIVIYTLLYLAVVFLDMKTFIKNKDKKVLFIYIPILLSTFAVNILYGLDVQISSPVKPIKNLIGIIFGVK